MIKYLKYFTKYKLSVLTVIFSVIITVSTTLIGPIYIGKAVSELTNKGDNLLHILIITFIIYLLNAIFLWIVNYITNVTTEKVAFTIRNQLFIKLFKLYDNYFYKNSEGNISNCFTNDLEKVTEGANLTISTFLIGIMTVIFGAVILCILNLSLAVIVLISAPICLGITFFITKNMQKYFQNQAKIIAKMNSFSLENIENSDLLHTNNAVSASIEAFKIQNDKLRVSSQKSFWYSSLVNPTTRIVNNILYCAIALLGALFVISGDIDVGILSTFLLYGNIFLKPINEITGAISSIASASASFERIDNILSENEDTETTSSTISEIKGEIKFENIFFSFNKEKSIFNDFSFTINPGETIAITGKTGAGKTTLVNLLLKFLKPDSGNIKLDNINISQLSNSFLRKTIGIVQQEPFIYAGSVYYNIAFGSDTLDESQIQKIAKTLYADAFISALSNGYNTEISNNGTMLSEGQKQLITICRAMYYNPTILILDEATSSIDVQSQYLIEKAIAKLKKNRTTLIIAHNEETISKADRELKIENK